MDKERPQSYYVIEARIKMREQGFNTLEIMTAFFTAISAEAMMNNVSPTEFWKILEGIADIYKKEYDQRTEKTNNQNKES